MDSVSEASPLFVVGIILAFMVVFPLIWSGTLLILSAVGGWGRLAKRFRDRDPADIPLETPMAVRLGWTNYRGVLNLGVADDALHLRTMAIFRPGHPPLRIPLEALSETPVKSLFGPRVSVDLAGVTKLVISEAVWRRVRGTPSMGQQRATGT